MKQKLIFCTKWGEKYGPEYVNNLFYMLKRHLTYPFKLVCFTDDDNGIIEKVETKPMLDNFTGWWNKISYFKKMKYTGDVLCLDLDMIIVSNIDSFFDMPGDFCILKDWHNYNGNNSSIIRFKLNQHTDIYDDFIKNYDSIMEQTGHKEKYWGDQMWITEKEPNVVHWPNFWVNSFKWQCLKDGRIEIPEKTKIVLFHGKPSPHELFTDERWQSRIVNFKILENAWLGQDDISFGKPKKIPTIRVRTNINQINEFGYKLYYGELDSNLIFNLTDPKYLPEISRRFSDWWDPKYDILRENIAKIYIDGFNQEINHYNDLEQSILNEGFRNPILVTAGPPVRRLFTELPLNLRNDPNNLLISEYLGGSRLMVAQKLKMKIPCLISDFVGRFKNNNDFREITEISEILDIFKDKPETIEWQDRGLYIRNLPYTHLAEKHKNYNLDAQVVLRKKIIRDIRQYVDNYLRK